MKNLMQGKKGIIMGVTNEHSIAWAIAKQLQEQGAELAFSYANEKVEKRIKNLAPTLNSEIILECNVTDSNSIANTFKVLEEKWGTLDFIVHSIAFSDKTELNGRYVDTTLSNFLNTMHVSCYSLTEICKFATPLMKNGGSIITLSYYGAEKVLPNYNVMGVAKSALECSVRYLANDLGINNIRVNSISAGPIKTLAASGIGDFNNILKWNISNSPLKRSVTQEEIAKSSLYLLSDLASGVTGENHYVDAGYNVVGMKMHTNDDE